MIVVAHDLPAWRALRPRRSSIGFVPTMGALHDGHLSLVRRALAENKFAVVSIFVNPTQFDNPDDLANYPATFAADCELLDAIGCHAVLAPAADLLYRDGYRVRVTDSEHSRVLDLRAFRVVTQGLLSEIRSVDAELAERLREALSELSESPRN